jgi:ubiquinone/menaquinone biosynthesis C-methylase UbiE
MSKMAVNYWHDRRCARAFWSQGDIPAHRQLLTDTVDWLDPAAGETWLDLGCGAGHLARELWLKCAGRLAGVVALDCAEANQTVIAKLADKLGTDRIRFHLADLSRGLPDFADDSIDGVTSGLAIQYAEHYCPQRGEWTRDSYQRILDEVNRVLRPGGRFIFSVNIPEPNWLKLSLTGALGMWTSGRPIKFLKNSYRMLRYGSWLKREARRGRFHYLPEATVRACLEKAGFVEIASRRSFAGLAYIFRACRPYS